MKKWIAICCLTSTIAVSSAMFAQAQPADNVGRKHPNLEAAQRLNDQAFKRLVASQGANEFDEGGHAAKAKELLQQAGTEMSQAAQFDNAHGK